jgi:hypothetical protein
VRSVGVLWLVLLATLAPASAAFAHGDGPTHFLEGDDLYPGYSPPPTSLVERELRGYVQAAARAGVPVKVAVATEGDVTDRPGALRRPQAYAEDVFRRIGAQVPVIIVTPYGVGIAGARTVDVDAPLHANSDLLAKTAMDAVRAVARAAHHPLPAHVQPAAGPPVGAVATPSPGADSRGWLPIGVFFAVFCGAALLFETRARLTRRRARLDSTSNLMVTEGQ